MKNWIEKGSVIEITLDNDKIVKCSTKYIDNMVSNLDIDKEEAVLTWLEDEGYMENLDQIELDNQAKVNKSNKIVNAKSTVKKTQKERVVKAQPEKESIIAGIAEYLTQFDGVSSVNIENKAKIITFTYKNNDYKVDLVQKRKPKE